jgi:hypothetical protein
MDDRQQSRELDEAAFLIAPICVLVSERARSTWEF